MQYGDWVLQRQEGNTNLSTLWLAYHRQTKDPAAIKILRDTPGASRERFARELDLGRLCQGRWVPEVLGGDLNAPSPWMAMEWLSDPTLWKLTQDGPLPAAQADVFCRQLWEAIAFLREHQVAHRDLQPKNVKVAPNGSVRLLDLGTGKAEDDETGVTDSTLPNTPGYAAPETFGGAGPVDWRADLWGWAALCVRAWTGHGIAPTSRAAYLSWLSDAIPDLAGLPQELEPAIRACLIANPDDRRLADVEAALPWTQAVRELEAARVLVESLSEGILVLDQRVDETRRELTEASAELERLRDELAKRDRRIEQLDRSNESSEVERSAEIAAREEAEAALSSVEARRTSEVRERSQVEAERARLEGELASAMGKIRWLRAVAEAPAAGLPARGGSQRPEHRHGAGGASRDDAFSEQAEPPSVPAPVQVTESTASGANRRKPWRLIALSVTGAVLLIGVLILAVTMLGDRNRANTPDGPEEAAGKTTSTSAGPSATSISEATTTSVAAANPQLTGFPTELKVLHWAECYCTAQYGQVKVNLGVTNSAGATLTAADLNATNFVLLLGPFGRSGELSAPWVAPPSPAAPFPLVWPGINQTVMAIPANPNNTLVRSGDFVSRWNPPELTGGATYLRDREDSTAFGPRGSDLVFNVPSPELSRDRYFGIGLVRAGTLIGVVPGTSWAEYVQGSSF